MKLIPKDTLVAEIDRRIKVLQNNPYENHKTICHLDSLKQSIDTLEVKEVDLDEHQIADIIQNLFPTDQFIESETLLLSRNEAILFAKHFFELGLKAQKGD